MQRRSLKKPEDEGPASPLTPEQVRARTFQHAAKLLAAKPRSIAELRERLLPGRGANEAIVEVVIARLREYGYLDDERFAIGYASAKVQQRPIGRQRLQRDLTFKKVERAAADEALDQVFATVSEEELINWAIEKRIRVRGRPKTRAEAKSLFDHLLRQGFASELVAAKVRTTAQASLDDDDAI
jgi:regulatory protein